PSVHGTVEDGRVRRPAGGAWLSLLVALLAGLLLNADGVAHIADVQPLGWRRSTARVAVAPFQAVSHALLLNRPRAWLAGAVDAPTFLDAGRDPKPVAPPPATVPEPTATTLAPLRVRAPSDDEPLRVYLTGDSFLADVSRGLSAVVAKDERWEPTTDAKVGTGLSRPEVVNWPARIKARLPSDVEVVVLGFGGNDAQDLLANRQRAKLAEPEWEAEYQARVGRVLDAVSQPGRTIVWIGMPVATANNMEKGRPAMTRAAQAELAKRPGTLFLDSAALLAGADGGYTDVLTIDGEPKRVRAADGFHLTPAGASLLGRSLVELIGTVWPLEPQGTESTTAPTVP
ncbi:MAG TPA: GDSL-type esterase/lipase family protein, partial [Acidimicrobiales bacterium]|nr:GDSL-type esterase/lipase family protein [Acidimicrobiales bacterium]